MIQSGVIQLTPFISHRLPLDEFCVDMELARHDPHRMKVQFAME